MFKLGLIINPLAGLGGSVGLKGSDGLATAEKALSLGAIPKASSRTLQALEEIKGLDLEIFTYPKAMGESAAKEAGFTPYVLGELAEDGTTSAADTINAAKDLVAAGVDIILFAGGDGTARNICEAIEDQVPVLGVPAGVKIHSGVYAITPKAAGQVLSMLIKGELVTLGEQEVRDIDEEAFRAGTVRAKYYGELCVPQEHRFMQHVKNGGKELEELVLDDIAADVIERMEPNTFYIMGSGSTVAAIMEQMGLANTLLGVDVVKDHELVASDCTAEQLLTLTEGHDTRLVITLIGGQGHLFGRGNQQLSPALIERLGKSAIHVVATKTKLKALDGRPLIVDTGEPALNTKLAGLIPVITGYHDSVLYRIADY